MATCTRTIDSYFQWQRMAGSGSSSASSSVSTKPWFLTEVNGDMLIWRNGIRLKVGGKSAGCVTEVSVQDGILLVSCPDLQGLVYDLSL